MKKNMGRPQKISSEIKLAILDQYHISCTVESTSTISKHGIYRKLSDFAKSIGYQLEAYDFSRDTEVRTRIAKLSVQIEDVNDGSSVPTYVPLDIPALMNRSQKQIEETLLERERYFHSLHIGAAHIIEDNSQLSKKVKYLQAELSASEEKRKNLENENKELAENFRDAKKEIAYLKRVIRKDVEPEKAQHFLQRMVSQESAIQTAKKTVVSSIDVLTKEDRQLRIQAENEVDKSDLNNLLKLIT